MKTDKKIPGFTLSEMIVVLILTSVVIGLAFSVLTLVQKHMHSIRQNFAQNTELQKLEFSLFLDFNRYSKIAYSDRTGTLLLSNSIDTISYKFDSEAIIKDTDTFPIKLDKKSFFFNGDKTENGQVDALKLKTSKAFQNKALFVFKNNAANSFVN